MLKAGGNAVDAAIAANATLQVVYPFVCGLGGDLFAIVWDAPSRTLIGLNASGRAPRAATIERYSALGHATMPRYGIHSVTVPGCVSGWACSLSASASSAWPARCNPRQATRVRDFRSGGS